MNNKKKKGSIFLQIFRIGTIINLGLFIFLVLAGLIFRVYWIVSLSLILYVLVGSVHVCAVVKVIEKGDVPDIVTRPLRLLPFDWRYLILFLWPVMWLGQSEDE